MSDFERFLYTVSDDKLGEASLMPYLPITLFSDHQEIKTSGLVDSGASVNALPYSLGLQLGLAWNSQEEPVYLSGNLARVEARGIVLAAQVGDFEPVRLVFAWAKSDDFPLILGQMNFFLEYEVYFFRAEQAFEIKPKK
jgi:hypothetical protein